MNPLLHCRRVRRITAGTLLLTLAVTGQWAGAEPWMQQAYVKASNTDGWVNSNHCGYNGYQTTCESVEFGDWFGRSVAVSGDTMVIGAVNEDSDATGVNGDEEDDGAGDSGAAYVLARSGTSWTQQAYLKATKPGGGPAYKFGTAVAVSGDTVVVSEANAVCIFVQQGMTWTQQAWIKASNAERDDSFGGSVAISGDTVVIGAWGEDSGAAGVNGDQTSNSAREAGAAYVFVREGTAWIQQAYLKASNTGAGDRFGTSVGISGETIVVGASFEDSNATGVNGSQTNNSANQSGAAYVFVRSGTAWSQQAYLKASNTGGDGSASGYGDYFGTSIAISGDTIVAGAYGEESNATGVNGNQSNNSLSFAGAAYIFVRSGTAWSQQAYLKASNSGAEDSFGWSVGLSGGTVIVGAMNEDSGTSGVNGPQTDNGKGDAGAAYVFERSGTTWLQKAYLKASNPDGDDRFGWAVAISDDTIVAGARDEDSDAKGVNGEQDDENEPNSGAAYVFVRPVPAPITGIERTPAGIRLTMPVRSGETTGIQYSASLHSGTWLDIGNVTTAAEVGVFINSDPVRLSRPAGFYRGFLR